MFLGKIGVQEKKNLVEHVKLIAVHSIQNLKRECIGFWVMEMLLRILYNNEFLKKTIIMYPSTSRLSVTAVTEKYGRVKILDQNICVIQVKAAIENINF